MCMCITQLSRAVHVYPHGIATHNMSFYPIYRANHFEVRGCTAIRSDETLGAGYETMDRGDEGGAGCEWVVEDSSHLMGMVVGGVYKWFSKCGSKLQLSPATTMDRCGKFGGAISVAMWDELPSGCQISSCPQKGWTGGYPNMLLQASEGAEMG